MVECIRQLHELTFTLRMLLVILIGIFIVPVIWVIEWLDPQHEEVT